MAKKTKKKHRKTKQNRKERRSLFAVVFFSIIRLFSWLVVRIFVFSRRRPLLAVGFFFFLFIFGAISYNAIFSQTQNQSSVFFKTRPEVINSSIVADQSVNTKYNKPLTTLSSNSASSATNTHKKVDQNIKLQQVQLFNSGHYKGPVDGLDGPRTRKAIAAHDQEKNASHAKLQADRTGNDSIGLLIAQDSKVSQDRKVAQDNRKDNSATTKNPPPYPRPRPDYEGTRTQSSPSFAQRSQRVDSVAQQRQSSSELFQPSQNDVVAVQTGLKKFGNHDIIISGQQDQTTVQKLKNFQKNFNLQENGQITFEVMSKMQDIGLFQ